MHQPRTWRELLGQSIENPYERERIAHMLGVSPITLLRWVRQESNPRLQNLQNLFDALPQHRELLLALVQEEFKGFSMPAKDAAGENVPAEIPAEFYTRVFRTFATIPRVLRFASLCDLILQQALEHLDPQRRGLAVIIARCMPPSHGHKVRSLRECAGRGTLPWGNHLEQQGTLLGSESLAGYSVSSHRLVTNPNLRDEHGIYPGYRGEWEESAAAAPIRRGDRVAGAFLVSSIRTNYFPPDRLALIQGYADLLSLAFEPEAYYDQDCIELWSLPPYPVQRPYFLGFRQRIISVMAQAAQNQQPLDFTQAEQFVWQSIEDELIALAAASKALTSS